jgi:hypothetical protein
MAVKGRHRIGVLFCGNNNGVALKIFAHQFSRNYRPSKRSEIGAAVREFDFGAAMPIRGYSAPHFISSKTPMHSKL